VGMFKRMKDMRDMVNAAPEMVQNARVLGAQAQEYAASQQAAMQQAGIVGGMATPAPAAAGTASTEPIAGVSLELYTEISKGLAAYNYDINMGPTVAATKGVSAEAWQEAMTGWNERIKADRAVAQRFNALYTGRAT
jgi:hypothetical protein